MLRVAAFVAGAIALVACTTNNITNVVETSPEGGASDASPLEDATGPSPDGGGSSSGGEDDASSPTATLSGSLYGQTIVGPSAVASFTPPTFQSFPPPGVHIAASLAVLITSGPALCGMMTAGPPVGGTQIGVSALAYVDAGLLLPGDYPVYSDSSDAGVNAGFFYFQQRTACMTYDDIAPHSEDGTPDPTPGVVTITSFDGGSVQGSFTVTIADGGTMSGTFDTPICAPGATYDAGCQ